MIGKMGLIELATTIARGTELSAVAAIASNSALATVSLDAAGANCADSKDWFFPEYGYFYKGQTALHVAAAVYRVEIVQQLISLGAIVAAPDRMGAQAIHLSAMGVPGSRNWNPISQSLTIYALVKAGADPNANDKRGVTPLHRAVRTRCAKAVETLLDCGADRNRKNSNGTTPINLAHLTTGRGGSGTQEAKAQQVIIIELLAN